MPPTVEEIALGAFRRAETRRRAAELEEEYERERSRNVALGLDIHGLSADASSASTDSRQVILRIAAAIHKDDAPPFRGPPPPSGKFGRRHKGPTFTEWVPGSSSP